MSNDSPKIDNAHFSEHFMKNADREGLHAISQQIRIDGKTIIAYTDVSTDGTVDRSGFDKKR